MIGNLTRPDGVLAPKSEVERVGIGTRVRMVFTDVAPGLALPQWTIDESAAGGTPWRYRGRGAQSVFALDGYGTSAYGYPKPIRVLSSGFCARTATSQGTHRSAASSASAGEP